MSRSASLLFRGAVVVAVAVALWWSFYVPSRPADIYRAIPIQADFLTTHRNLAARWDDVFANSLVAGLFASANLKTSELREMREGPQFRDWLNRLASEEIVFAQVPGLANGEAGWVFASWIGGRSQRLRLGLLLSKIPDITYAGTRRGWPVWEMRSRMFKGGETLSFSLVEGMLVGSYARNPRAIDTVLGCVDGRYPSVGRLAPESIPPADQKDAGWMRLSDPRAGLAQSPRITFAFETLASNRLAGVVRAPFPWLKGVKPLAAEPPAFPAKLLNDLPQAVLVTPSGPTCNWILLKLPGFTSVVASDLIDGQTVGPLYSSLVTGDYGGELFGMKWPTLVVAAASTNADALENRLVRRMEHLNSLKPWRLQVDACTAGSNRVLFVSSASNTLYAESRPDDRIALATGDGWFLGASNLGGLTNLMRDAVIRQNRALRLNSVAEQARRAEAAAWFWCNLPEAGRSIRIGLGAWALQMNAIGDRDSKQTRNIFATIRRWIVCAEPLGELSIGARPVDDGTEFRFSTTPP